MNSYTGHIGKLYSVALTGGFCLLSASCSSGKTESSNEKMNVLFLLADDLRWNSLHCMGNNILYTPNLDSLAADGIRFTNACVTTSISMVSRASLLTGQYMSRHGIRDFGVSLSPEAFSLTYPALLRKAGYYSGFVGKYGVGKIDPDNFDFSREYEGKHWWPEGNGDSIHVTARNCRDALTFLKDRPKNIPFVLSVSFFATHAEDNHPDQYRYQPESEAFYKNDTIPVPETSSDVFFMSLPYFLSTEVNEGRIRWHWRFDSSEKYQRYMKAYYRMLTELDAATGKIINELKEQGVYENTLIIFMGDNGYFHSEHGLADKWYPYEESVRVPLIVHDPRLGKTKRNGLNEEFVLNIDIAPLIISATGIDVPETMQGEDFSKLYLLDKKYDWREDFYYEHPFVTNESRIPSSEAIITHDSKYIMWPYYKYEEYFDLSNDRKETTNLMNNPAYSLDIKKMKTRLDYFKANCVR
ncbi:MAG TPA: sulfatase [Bacteroidales bacterium]|nr:sulfatase [Bacteroidales bacterium]